MNDLKDLKVIGIPWFSRDDWDDVRALCVDRQAMPVRYDDYVRSAEHALKQLQVQGMVTEKVDMRPAYLAEWCRARGKTVNARARAEYAAWAVDLRHHND